MKNLSLNKILEQVWKLIKNGVKDGSSSFHISTISTINLQGYPSSCSVVIRNLNQAIVIKKGEGADDVGGADPM